MHVRALLIDALSTKSKVIVVINFIIQIFCLLLKKKIIYKFIYYVVDGQVIL